jgi:hypothetical protein
MAKLLSVLFAIEVSTDYHRCSNRQAGYENRGQRGKVTNKKPLVNRM